MIGNKHRFHGRGSLRRVYQGARTVRSKHIALKYQKNERRKQWRATVVVAKKVHKSAVVRNRIRRRIYAAIEGLMPPNAPAYDMVFTVFHENIATMPAPELQESTSALLHQAGVLPPKPQRTAPASHDMIEGKE